jgi:hypothetical protein
MDHCPVPIYTAPLVYIIYLDLRARSFAAHRFMLQMKKLEARNKKGFDQGYITSEVLRPG